MGLEIDSGEKNYENEEQEEVCITGAAVDTGDEKNNVERDVTTDEDVDVFAGNYDEYYEKQDDKVKGESDDLRPWGAPGKDGLYNPAYEKEACGVGFIVSIEGKPSHKVSLCLCFYHMCDNSRK